MKNLFVWFTVSCVVLSCASAPPAPPTVVIPSVDYSLVGSDDSVVIVYIDPSLMTADRSRVAKGDFSQWLTFTVWANPGNYNSERIINYASNIIAHYKDSGQFALPNGEYTLQVTAVRGSIGLSDNLSARTVAITHDIELQDVAIVYKIRPAADEEKREALLSVGGEVYTLEEISRTKLRER